MDRNAAITAARACIEAAGLKQEDLFPASACAREQEQGIDDLLPRRRWVPEDETTHYYLDSWQDVCENEWESHTYDFRLLNAGNVFPSIDAAKEHAANMRAWIELRERSDNPADGWFCAGGMNTLPGVGFSTQWRRDIAVNHIGQDRIDNLARWIWNVKD